MKRKNRLCINGIKVRDNSNTENIEQLTVLHLNSFDGWSKPQTLISDSSVLSLIPNRILSESPSAPQIREDNLLASFGGESCSLRRKSKDSGDMTHADDIESILDGIFGVNKSFERRPCEQQELRRNNIKPQIWTQSEIIILVGLIFEVFFRRGSLFPNKKNGETSGVCWSDIKAKFDVAWSRYVGMGQVETRTKVALRRRYKILKATAAAEDKQGNAPFFKNLYRIWETEYNVRGILTCSVEQFEQFNNQP